MLTHWAVFDDSRRLAAADRQVEPSFRESIETERDFARLGSLSRGGGRWVPAILAWAREARTQAQPPPGLGRNVAFALGGITHAACDRLMKPLMSHCAGVNWDATHHAMQRGEATEAMAVQEVSAYYDAHVFRKVYLGGAAEPFGRSFLSLNDTVSGAALEEYMRAQLQRALLAAHTLAPPADDILGWLDRLAEQLQPYYLDVALWVKVFQQPDPALLQRYMVETAFYREDDPAIKLARAAQEGEPPAQEALDAALAPGANAGRYGQAVETAVRYLRGASAYWRGETGLAGLKAALDFGRPDAETHPLRLPGEK
jgi:hypothetical protein